MQKLSTAKSLPRDVTVHHN